MAAFLQAINTNIPQMIQATIYGSYFVIYVCLVKQRYFIFIHKSIKFYICYLTYVTQTYKKYAFLSAQIGFKSFKAITFNIICEQLV